MMILQQQDQQQQWAGGHVELCKPPIHKLEMKQLEKPPRQQDQQQQQVAGETEDVLQHLALSPKTEKLPDKNDLPAMLECRKTCTINELKWTKLG